MRTLFASVLIVVAASLSTAVAQTGVPMPSPEDFVLEPWDRKVEDGACGRGLGGEVYGYLQQIYARQGQCASYGQQYDRKGDKVVWVNYKYDTPSPHTIQGFFSYYDLLWWDGWVPPEAHGTPYDAQVASRSTRAETTERSRVSPSSGRLEADADEKVTTSNDSLGACGVPYPNENVRKVQEISEQNGMCDWYRQNVGADGK